MAERLSIIIEESGSRVVVRNIAAIGAQAQKTGHQMGGLNKVMGGLAAGFIVRGIVGMADAYTTLRNKLQNVVPAGQTVGDTMDRLFDMANHNRVAVDNVVTTYQRLTLAGRRVGASQERVFRTTDTLSKMMVVYGATNREAAAAMLQLSQSFAKGKLDGDELKTVLESAPQLADVLAKKLGVTAFELKELGSQGKITSKVMFEALEEAGAQVDAQFAKTTPTVAQSFQVLHNKAIQFIGEADQASGATRTLSKIILFLGDHLDVVASILVGLGIALTGVFAVKAVQSIMKAVEAVKLFSSVVMSNPLGIIITALGLIIGLVTDWGTETENLKPIFEELKTAAWEVWKVVKKILEGLASAIKGFRDLGMKLGQGLLTGDFENTVDTSSRVGKIEFTQKALRHELERRRKEALAGPGDPSNPVTSGVVKDFQDVASGAKSPLEWVGDAVTGGGVSATMAGMRHGAFGNLSDADIQKSIDKLEKQKRLASAIDKLENNPDKDGLDRPDTDLGPLKKIPQPPDKAAQREFKRFLEALKKLENEVDPVLAAYRELQEAQDLLTRGVKVYNETNGKLGVSEERSAVILERKKELLQDQLDPLGAVKRELEKEIGLLAMDTEERERATRIMTIEQQLRAAGVVLDEAGTVAIENRLDAIKRLTEEQEFQNQEIEKQKALLEVDKQTLESIRPGVKAYEDQLASLSRVMDRGTITQAEFTKGQRMARMAFLETQLTEAAGVERGLLRIQGQLEDTASSVEAVITNAFSQLEDQLVQLTTKGEFSFSAMVDSMLADMTRLTFRTGLLELLGGQGAGNGGKGILGLGGLGALFAQTGGQWMVKGSGGPDSVFVPTFLSPGERLTVENKRQQREGTFSGGPAGPPQAAQAGPVIVVFDMKQAMEEAFSSPAFDRHHVRVVRANPEQVRQAIGK